MISNNPNFGIPTGFKCITVKVSNNKITGYTMDGVVTCSIGVVATNNSLIFSFNKDAYWFFGLNTFTTNTQLSINYSPTIALTSDLNTYYQPDECNPTLLHIIQKGYSIAYTIPTNSDWTFYLYYFER